MGRFFQLADLSQEHEGIVCSGAAAVAGVTPSALSRMASRGRLDRICRGVFRIPFMPVNRFSQFRETVLWAQAHSGPVHVAISHESALSLLGISDANPSNIHLTVPRTARLRRAIPPPVQLHRAAFDPETDVMFFEGIPVTTIARTIGDLLAADCRADILNQAISAAKKEGFITDAEARRLRRRLPPG